MAYGAVQTELRNKRDNTIRVMSHNDFDVGSYDSITLTYVASGNGAGEIETVVYSLDGTTVATLTLSYNASNKLESITKG